MEASQLDVQHVHMNISNPTYRILLNETFISVCFMLRNMYMFQFFSMPLQKTATWIQSPFMSFPTKHRMKNEEIHRIFQELPEEEKLIDGKTAHIEYTCYYIILHRLLMCSSEGDIASGKTLHHSELVVFLCQHLHLGNTGKLIVMLCTISTWTHCIFIGYLTAGLVCTAKLQVVVFENFLGREGTTFPNNSEINTYPIRRTLWQQYASETYNDKVLVELLLKTKPMHEINIKC